MESNGESWLKKYYPVEADTLINDSDIECVQHSLNKWRGLTKNILRKYGLVANGCVIEDDRFVFYVDSSSCALCQKYIEKRNTCIGCPLFKQLGKPCEASSDSPYTVFRREANPLPMIDALEKTLMALTIDRKEDGNE